MCNQTEISALLYHIVKIRLFFFQDAATYQSDLLKQMEFQKTLREFEAQQTRRELELQKEAETLHQARVSEALARPHPDKIHPKRLLISGQGLL